MIHLMNSAVMPAGNYGRYDYRRASLDALRCILREGERHTYLCRARDDERDLLNDWLQSGASWVSAIGYPQNADLIEQWTGVRVPIARTETVFADGDAAFVMRLRRRVFDPATKGAPVSADPADWEFAWVVFRSDES